MSETNNNSGSKSKFESISEPNSEPNSEPKSALDSQSGLDVESQTNSKKTVETKSIYSAAIFLSMGAVLAFLFQSAYPSKVTDSEDSGANDDKPLYWVAPMDDNYRRDKPGLSPMGMDLIPVYATNKQTSVGSISISPTVMNNLGVRTATVEKRALNSVIKTVGYVQYDEEKLLHIHPRVEGWVEKLHVKAEGDPVNKDQPLYEIYSPALVNAQEEFLIALQRNNKRLVSAAKERLSALQLPNKEIEELQQKRTIKQRITFLAPQSGVIDNLNIREGFYVKPGTTLMSIGQLDQVWVEAEVFERQSSQIVKGLPVTMTLDYLPGSSWQGEVDYVYPALNPKTRTLKTRLRFDNSDFQLKPNMFAQIVISLADEMPRLLIPREALIRTGDQDRVVLALGDGAFKSVAVSVGRYDKQFVEILSGVEEGEVVVSSAQFLLDSESSKSSDFKRMETSSMSTEIERDDKPESAMVEGVIKSLNIAERMVNIDRGAIEKWGREAANVDFRVDSTVDLTQFKASQKVSITFHYNAEEFVITKMKLIGEDQ
jgi:Cu(I)/Ag(I) efflux system membrane fusion protein